MGAENDDGEVCPDCRGIGVVEMEFPVSSHAEEPDIREVPCETCSDGYWEPEPDCDSFYERLEDDQD